MAGAKIAMAVLLLASPTWASVLRGSGGSCACLPWKDAYARGAKCGAGYEFGTFKIMKFNMPHILPEFIPKDLYNEFCTNFYMRGSHSSCLNMRFGSPAEQWCYVPRACAARESDKIIDSLVALHNCSADAGDRLMKTTAPEELNRLAGVDKLEIGLFGKLSYAMDEMKWSDVEKASSLPEELYEKAHTMEQRYGIEYAGPKDATAEARLTVQQVVESGVTTVFDADNGHGGGTLLAGSKIYGFLPLAGTEGMGYVCLHGC